MIFFDTLKNDLHAHRGTNLLRALNVFLFDAKFRLLLNYRIGNKFHNSRYMVLRFLARYYKYKMITKRNCQISYSAKIGKNIKFLHPLGVVIGDGCEIGNNVSIWQHVTLGSHGSSMKGRDYPIIEDDVKIYAGATIIGGVKIGVGSVIAANSLVNKDVEPRTVVGGVPAKVLKNN